VASRLNISVNELREHPILKSKSDENNHTETARKTARLQHVQNPGAGQVVSQESREVVPLQIPSGFRGENMSTSQNRRPVTGNSQRVPLAHLVEPEPTVSACARTKNIGGLRTALLSNSPLSQGDLDKAIATWMGSHIKVQNSQPIISEMDRDSHKILNKLLVNGANLSIESRGWAMRAAAAGGQLEIIKTLLMNRPRIEDMALGLALQAAVRNGHLHVVKFLIEGHIPISEEHKSEALIAATEANHLGVVNVLLANTRMGDVQFNWAFLTAARRNNVDMVRVFLGSQQNRISDENLRVAAVDVVKSGSIEMFDLLLRQRPTIAKEIREEMLTIVARRGYGQIVQRFLASGGEISTEHRGQAVLAATDANYPQILDELLMNGALISNNDRVEALRIANQKNLSEMARKLLRGVPLTWSIHYYAADFINGVRSRDVRRLIQSPITQTVVMLPSVAYLGTVLM